MARKKRPLKFWKGLPPKDFSVGLGQAKLFHELLHNCRIKEYPQGFIEVLSASRPIFREPGWELSDDWWKGSRISKPVAAAPADDEAKKADNIARAVRRAKQNLRDLALCNDMAYFVTLTLDPALVDRYDMVKITKRLNVWCSNQVQRNGLAYVLVPERHKDGAVHFHGFVNKAVEVVDSGTISVPWDKKPRRPTSEAQRNEWLAKGGKIVYNLPAWPLGFTTAIEMYGDPVAAVNYCCKYIGKQQGSGEPPEKIGGRWFYHGGCHGRPKVTYADIDFEEMELADGAFVWEVPAAGVLFAKEKINL